MELDLCKPFAFSMFSERLFNYTPLNIFRHSKNPIIHFLCRTILKSNSNIHDIYDLKFDMDVCNSAMNLKEKYFGKHNYLRSPEYVLFSNA